MTVQCIDGLPTSDLKRSVLAALRAWIQVSLVDYLARNRSSIQIIIINLISIPEISEVSMASMLGGKLG